MGSVGLSLSVHWSLNPSNEASLRTSTPPTKRTVSPICPPASAYAEPGTTVVTVRPALSPEVAMPMMGAR